VICSPSPQNEILSTPPIEIFFAPLRKNYLLSLGVAPRSADGQKMRGERLRDFLPDNHASEFWKTMISLFDQFMKIKSLKI